MNKDKKYSNIKISNLENSEVLIEGEILAEFLEEHRKKAVTDMMERAELPGFRKGKAPENMVLQHYGEDKILEHAATDAIDAEYWNIVSDNSIKAIGNPNVTITKIAKGNPLGFKIKTAVFPEIKLPDYKVLAKKENENPEEVVEVTQKEVDDILEQLKKTKAGEKGDVEESLPDLDDAFAQSLGDFKDVADLTEKIRANMLAEKKMRSREKRRLTILEAILKGTDIAIPEMLIENENQKMLAQFKNDISRTGLTYEAYLAKINKTQAEIFSDWRDNAIKRAKTQLMLAKISADEKIAPSEEEVTKEIDHIVEHHPDADRYKARMYVENMMTNEKVLEYLEKLK